ncbi:MAG: response regulator [Rhodospirillales bacterium]|nr:response regulator [Rhodospirillales bacterium]
MILSDLKVLVVDDYAEIRVVLRTMLNAIGVTCINEADNGVCALEFIKTHSDEVDILICDWNMPGLSGMDILKSLRDRGSDMPVIIITGRGGGLESCMAARYSRATSFIQKPCSVTRMEVELRAILRHINENRHKKTSLQSACS